MFIARPQDSELLRLCTPPGYSIGNAVIGGDDFGAYLVESVETCPGSRPHPHGKWAWNANFSTAADSGGVADTRAEALAAAWSHFNHITSRHQTDTEIAAIAPYLQTDA